MTYEETHKQLEAEYDRVIADTLAKLKKTKPLTKRKLAALLLKANKAYWTARIALLDTDAVAEADELAKAFAAPYALASEVFSDRVRSIYANYQSAFDLSRDDADELMKHVVYDRTIAENLKAVAEELPEGEEKQRILAEISAPAYQYRLERAEELERQAKDITDRIARNEISADREFLQTQVEKAYNIALDDALGKTPAEAVLDEILPEPIQPRFNEMLKASEPVQNFTPTNEKGIQDSFSLVSEKHVREITGSDWSGREFSERIWNNTDELAKEIKQVLIEGELTGASEADMAEKISERFNVAMYKARRVVRTEGNYCINQAELKAMQDAGFDEYEFVTLGENAEGVCDNCDDLNGLRFKISDATVGINFPPMHPFCRCKVTTPQESLEDIQREIDERIESWNIPEGMSLDEFIERVNNGELEQIREEQNGTTETPNNENVIGKTIEEAEQKAEELGVRHVDYSDLPLNTANTLNEAINSLPPETRPAYVGSGKNMQEAIGRKFERTSKNYFGVHLDAMDFRFGEYPNIVHDFEGGQAVGISNTYKNLDKIPDVKEKYNTNYAEKHDGHTWYYNTEDGRSVAFHEMGHVYADVKGIPEGFAEDAERWAAESKCDMLKSTNEAWAEAWGAYHTQNPDLPDYIAKYVDERTNTPIDKSVESDIISKKVSDRITHFYDKNGEAYSDEEIEKALMSSPIGADSAKFIEDNGYNLEFYYNTESNGLAGDVYGKHIEIYPDEHIDAKDIASTIVHEVSHEKYNWKGTQENEINCYLMERFFKFGDVSERDIKECVLLVKEKYPELPRGDLYGYDS